MVETAPLRYLMRRDPSPAQPPPARSRRPRAACSRRSRRSQPVSRACRGALESGACRGDSVDPSTPSTPPAPTRTYTRTYTPPATTAPSGPTASQLAAQRAAAQKAKAQARAHKLAALRHRHQVQLLAAAQTHAEAVLRAELAAARRTDAVDTLAVSVADSIGAVPAGGLPRAAASAGAGGGASFPLPALALAACAGLLGIAAAFASRRGVGFATAALSLIVLLAAGI